jgi:hypothetical protein
MESFLYYLSLLAVSDDGELSLLTVSDEGELSLLSVSIGNL